VSFDYFWSIDTPNNKPFRTKIKEQYPDVIMNTVGVGMYNAAHMAAKAIEQAGEVTTDGMRSALEGMTFDGAPQGSLTMRAEDHQAVLPSYLVQAQPDWTGPDDMFKVVNQVASVEPEPAQCDSLPLSKG
jgi:urea transport system substrate-binding protein